MPAFLPFYIQHSPLRYETRLKPPAQPPLYDLAFCWYANQRVMWPIEAKVLRTARRVASTSKRYAETFLRRYAPFSSEAAMLVYLVSGDISQLFNNLEAKIPCTLNMHRNFRDRPHRISDHIRHVPSGKSYPAQLSLHHLVLQLLSSNTY